jgi:hypothetical protein
VTGLHSVPEPPDPIPTEVAAVGWTERRVLDRLRQRHDRMTGNGPTWVYMEHVRDAAGFDAGTTIDALTMHLWPSQHFALSAYEVKVSRGDWRRELAKPWKSEPWTKVADYFWIVAPRGVALVEELPDKWGLLELAGPTGVFRVARAARRLSSAMDHRASTADLKRTLIASMLRAAVRTEKARHERTIGDLSRELNTLRLKTKEKP